MKLLKLTGNVIKWIIIILILLFSLATFMGKSYGQTAVFVLIALALAYWPSYFKRKYNKRISFLFRSSFIVILILIKITILGSEQKTSIYISEEARQELMDIYDEKVKYWPGHTEDIHIPTDYGTVHVLACGDENNPPVMMIHAASMGAHSWAENLEPLLGSYRIYSIDNLGEGNKSELYNALVFPQNEKEIADLYSVIADSLGIEKSHVFGASNGGYVAMCYTYHYPERVRTLSLFGPMGLTGLTNSSIFMLSVATMYPFRVIRNYVAKWALGESEYCNEKYGDWFSSIMKGTIPSLARPVPMTTAQKEKMDLPVLLFLGTKDLIVGDAEVAKKTAEEYPNIRIEIMESGHLISAEHYERVNAIVKEFLDQNEIKP